MSPLYINNIILKWYWRKYKSYCKASKSCDELIDGNIKYTNNFRVTEKEKTLRIMYWTPEMYRI